MKEEKLIRISQCMIVKNEEKNIEKALSWGKSVVWEQIVVDTGSTDRTVELAKGMGAKVYFMEWIDDFAAAKNFAISKAKGEWIAFLDADEYLLAADAEKLPGIFAQLSGRGLDGLMTGWQQLDDNGNIFLSGSQLRFFRNDPDIRYQKRIHERLASVSGRMLHLGDAVSAFSVFHTGYQSAVAGAKNDRNRRLIVKELEEHPDDYEMMGYMGDACHSSGEWRAAREWYERSITYMPEKLEDNDQRSAATFTRLLLILSEMEEKSMEEMKGVHERAVRLLPEDADFDYILGRYYAVQKQAGSAIPYLETAVKKLDTYGCNNKAMYLAGNLLDAYDLLVKCSYEEGEYQKCITYAVTYLKYEKYEMSILVIFLKVLLSDENQNNYREIMDFLLRLYDFQLVKDRLFLMKSAEISGNYAFRDFVVNDLFSKEERKILKL